MPTTSSAVRKHLAFAAIATCLVFSSQGRADPTDSAAAQALFDQGKQLMAASRFAEACPKLQESQRLDPALGTVLNLADCYEKAQRLASAWTTFVEAQGLAHTAGQAEAERVARERAAKLAPRVSKLLIEVGDPSTAAGLEVRRDNLVVGSAQWGVAIPADGGDHTVTASAPGHKPWETRVRLAMSGATIKVQVPVLVSDPTPTSSAMASPPAPTGGISAPDHAPSGSLGTQKTVAIVTAGVGVVGLAIGTVFGLQSKSKRDEALDGHCIGAICNDQTGIDLKNDAIHAGNIATGGFLVGGAGLATAAVLWFTSKSSSQPIMVGMGPESVAVMGLW